jgi:hypothetical protein
MAGASCPPGVFDQAAFNMSRRSNVQGDPQDPSARLAHPHVLLGDPCFPVINQLFGALIDVPPNAWLFV